MAHYRNSSLCPSQNTLSTVLPHIVSEAKFQFIKSKIEIFRQLFEFATISKFKKEYIELYEEIRYLKFVVHI